ncbi:MAG: YebC/PmpR family DNA-binding transcriptional regulator [Patescibacteria group bacterium]|jgi:YebC/PmpR family DNA-binding regulatory protein
MSGHSKWATTHRQKSVADAKRGAIFTKLGNVITIAARKGGDPSANPSLRAAIDRAREASMPKDNIERAIKRGTGELGGEVVEELYYEGVLPAGVQVVVKCITDNKNRSSASVRHAFTKHGGSLGAVLWNFDQLGVIMISRAELRAKEIEQADLELALIDLNVAEIISDEEGLIIQTEIKDFITIKDYLENQGLSLESAEIEYVAKDKLSLETAEQETVDRCLEMLEDNEDVSACYTNLE